MTAHRDLHRPASDGWCFLAAASFDERDVNKMRVLTQPPHLNRRPLMLPGSDRRPLWHRPPVSVSADSRLACSLVRPLVPEECGIWLVAGGRREAAKDEDERATGKKTSVWPARIDSALPTSRIGLSANSQRHRETSDASLVRRAGCSRADTDVTGQRGNRTPVYIVNPQY